MAMSERQTGYQDSAVKALSQAGIHVSNGELEHAQILVKIAEAFTSLSWAAEEVNTVSPAHSNNEEDMRP